MIFIAVIEMEKELPKQSRSVLSSIGQICTHLVYSDPVLYLLNEKNYLYSYMVQN